RLGVADRRLGGQGPGELGRRRPAVTALPDERRGGVQRMHLLARGVVDAQLAGHLFDMGGFNPPRTTTGWHRKTLRILILRLVLAPRMLMASRTGALLSNVAGRINEAVMCRWTRRHDRADRRMAGRDAAPRRRFSAARP